MGVYVLEGPHKSMCNSCNGLVDGISFELNGTQTCFPNKHDFQILFSGNERFGRYLTTLLLSYLTIRSKFICPSLLCHN